MSVLFGKLKRIRGVDVPPRRFTGWALVYFVVFLCLPLLGVAVALDVALYFLWDTYFESCYAVLCLLE